MDDVSIPEIDKLRYLQAQVCSCVSCLLDCLFIFQQEHKFLCEVT